MNDLQETIKKFRRSANIGLYGSLTIVLLTIIYSFCPFHVTYQQPEVARWMLISGIVLAVLAVVMVLMALRRNAPKLRNLNTLADKINGYSNHVTSLYNTTFAIVAVECALIVLMSDNSLLMVTCLLVLMLFVAYPNMYKMKNDLGLSEQEMTALFGSDYIADPQLNEDVQEAEVVDEKEDNQ